MADGPPGPVAPPNALLEPTIKPEVRVVVTGVEWTSRFWPLNGRSVIWVVPPGLAGPVAMVTVKSAQTVRPVPSEAITRRL